MTGPELASDALSQDAVDRCFEVIGEAARQLTPDCRARHARTPWPLIIGMRHRIIHEYTQVDYALVLKTVQEHLPSLIQQVEAILAAESPPEP